jgi:hypothetical protein
MIVNHVVRVGPLFVSPVPFPYSFLFEGRLRCGPTEQVEDLDQSGPNDDDQKEQDEGLRDRELVLVLSGLPNRDVPAFRNVLVELLVPVADVPGQRLPCWGGSQGTDGQRRTTTRRRVE